MVWIAGKPVASVAYVSKPSFFGTKLATERHSVTVAFMTTNLGPTDCN